MSTPYADTVIEAIVTALEAVDGTGEYNTATNLVLRRDRKSKVKYDGKRARHYIYCALVDQNYSLGANDEVFEAVTINIDSHLNYSDAAGYSVDEQELLLGHDVRFAVASLRSSLNCTFERLTAQSFREVDPEDPVPGVTTSLTISYLLRSSDFENVGPLA